MISVRLAFQILKFLKLYHLKKCYRIQNSTKTSTKQEIPATSLYLLSEIHKNF